MRDTRKHLFAVAAALSALLAAPLVQAQEFGPGPGGRGWHRGKARGFGPRMAAALGLTDQQKAEVERLRTKMKEDTAPIRKQLQERRQELHKLWSADRPSAKKIISKHAEMDPLRAEMRAYRVRFRIAVRDLLTADQLKKLQELKGKGKGRRGRGRGMMGPGGMMGPEGGPVGWCGVNADPQD